MKKRLLASLFALTLAGTALAQVNHTSQADLRYSEGMAFFKKSDFENARQSFLQAYALSPEPRYLWNLSVSEIESKHPADALNHFRIYFRSSEVRAGDQEKAKPYMDGAQKQTLQVHIVAPTGARLTIDGNQLKDDAPLPDDVAVMPGRHVVEARLVDRVKSATFEGTAGSRTEVKIEIETTPVPSTTATIAPSASSSATAPVPTGSSTAPPPPSNAGKFIGAGVLTGIGVIGMVGWGAFAAVANGAESDANAYANTGACADRTSAACNDLQSKLDKQGTFHAASIASLVVGAVFLAGGIGVFTWALTSKSKQTGLSFTPTLTAGGMGATLQGSF